jgi:signal transduction histidine kinase
MDQNDSRSWVSLCGPVVKVARQWLSGLRARIFAAVFLACALTMVTVTLQFAAIVKRTLLDPLCEHVVDTLELVPDGELQSRANELYQTLGVRVTVVRGDERAAHSARWNGVAGQPAFDALRDGRHYHVIPPPPASFGAASVRALSIACLISIVGAMAVVAVVTRPVLALSAAATAIGRGAFDVPIDASGSDELGDLAKSLREMSARLQRMVRMEKAVTASISHELRTPMARIRMGLALAEEGDEARARAALAGIGRDLDELDRVLADLVDTARLELRSDTLPLRRVLLDVNATVVEAIVRTIGVCATLSANERVELIGDRVLIRRAVENLLSNAMRHGAPPVGVSIAVSDEMVVIRVVDAGRAVDAHDLELLAEPFVQSDTSAGLGLGLTLTRAVANAHGGRLELVRSREGGLAATLILPVAEETHAAERHRRMAGAFPT